MDKHNHKFLRFSLISLKNGSFYAVFEILNRQDYVTIDHYISRQDSGLALRGAF
jgi:hypothetical protein